MTKKAPNKAESSTRQLPFVFQGVKKPNYTQVPDEILDLVIPFLSGAETKVLLYIIRRTFGFKKDTDRISLRQMVNGITTGDGHVLDYGTGLSKGSVISALKTLLAMNIIQIGRSRTDERGDETNTYSLNFAASTLDDGPPAAAPPTPVQKSDTPSCPKIRHSRVQKADIPRVQKLDPQETEQQETGQQQTEATTRTADSEGSDTAVVVAGLVDFGISQKIAERWAAEHAPLYLQEKVEYAQFLLARAQAKIKNPKGWLRKAIEENYDAPDGFVSQAARDAEASQRALAQQQQEEFAWREMAEQQTTAQRQKEIYRHWREQLSQTYGTTPEDFRLWQRTRLGLKTAFIGREAVYDAFVARAEILCVRDDKVWVGVDSVSAVHRLNHKHHILFEREFQPIFKKPMKVEFVAVGQPKFMVD